MRKKAAIGISIVLIVVLAVLFWQDKKREEKIQAIYREMDQETRPISHQIYDLEDQISELEKKVSAVQTGTATTQFLITDLSKDSYNEIIHPMSTYSYPVVLGLSLDEMPGQDGCMTAEQAVSLAAQGWTFCYAYQVKEIETVGEQSADTLAAWMEHVGQDAVEAGIDLEPVVYFPSGTYQKEFASVLKVQGIQTVIHHGELGNGLLTATHEDGLWYVGSAWWRGNEILDNKLATISSSGGELVTLMGIDSSAKNSLQDWMGQFEGILKQNRIEVTNFSEMAAIQEENTKTGAEEATSYSKQAEELTRQKEELEQQKEEIEDSYNEKAMKLRK